jgi:hypothetical protein
MIRYLLFPTLQLVHRQRGFVKADDSRVFRYQKG